MFATPLHHAAARGGLAWVAGVVVGPGVPDVAARVAYWPW